MTHSAQPAGQRRNTARGPSAALAAAFLVLGGGGGVCAEEAKDDPLWTDQPVKVDRSAQPYERIEAKPLPVPEPNPFTLRFTGKSRYAIIDSVTFEEGGKRYRLADLEPVPSSRICKDETGVRWACGLRARAALGGLISGRPLRCAPRSVDGGMLEVECRRAGKDLGESLVRSGNALVAAGVERYDEAEEKARDARAGIWRDAPPAPQ